MIEPPGRLPQHCRPCLPGTQWPWPGWGSWAPPAHAGAGSKSAPEALNIGPLCNGPALQWLVRMPRHATLAAPGRPCTAQHCPHTFFSSRSGAPCSAIMGASSAGRRRVRLPFSVLRCAVLRSAVWAVQLLIGSKPSSQGLGSNAMHCHSKLPPATACTPPAKHSLGSAFSR